MSHYVGAKGISPDKMPDFSRFEKSRTPAPATSAAGEATAQIHVEHYFPKGYDPKVEPWQSISKHVAALREQLEQLQAWKDYAEGLGLRIGICKSSDCPEGRLAHDLAEGSELHRIFDEWSHSIGMAEQLATAQKEASEAQATLKRANELGCKVAENGKWTEEEWSEHQRITRQPDSSALNAVIEAETAKQDALVLQCLDYFEVTANSLRVMDDTAFAASMMKFADGVRRQLFKKRNLSLDSPPRDATGVSLPTESGAPSGQTADAQKAGQP